MGQSKGKQNYNLEKYRATNDPSELSDVNMVKVEKRRLDKETEISHGITTWTICLSGLNRNSSDVNHNKRQNIEKNVQLMEEFCKPIINYSKELPELVKKYNGSEIKLKEPKDYAVRITDLDGTVYWGRDEMLESWSELYLPEPTEMVVIGAIDNFPSLAEGLQLIVLVDSQGKVYFYENEVLHLIACSLNDFFKEGATSPPIQSHKYGQYIAPKSKEEYLKLLDEIARTEKNTENFIQNKDKDLTELLDFLECF
ncbi:uncharacterized protein LOC125717868 [Brienomyrus brachyistius]|uniref:uncharacterized protein LOC125717868 n=1 Tax=Brienomyrus brachyistius TaxID=42636 RepID=UPI0020B3598C|nr:uncharacterized protein LOC125717868 [Brienomyrus brachyistius]